MSVDINLLAMQQQGLIGNKTHTGQKNLKVAFSALLENSTKPAIETGSPIPSGTQTQLSEQLTTTSMPASELASQVPISTMQALQTANLPAKTDNVELPNVPIQQAKYSSDSLTVSSNQAEALIESYVMTSWATGQMSNSYFKEPNAKEIAANSLAINPDSKVQHRLESQKNADFAVANQASSSVKTVMANTLTTIANAGSLNKLAERSSKSPLVAMNIPTITKLKDKNLTQTKDEQGLKLWLRDFTNTNSELKEWLVAISQTHQHISQVAYNGHVIWQR